MPPKRANQNQNNGGTPNSQIVMDRNTFIGIVQEVIAQQQQMQNPGDNRSNQEGQTMFYHFMK